MRKSTLVFNGCNIPGDSRNMKKPIIVENIDDDSLLLVAEVILKEYASRLLNANESVSIILSALTSSFIRTETGEEKSLLNFLKPRQLTSGKSVTDKIPNGVLPRNNKELALMAFDANRNPVGIPIRVKISEIENQFPQLCP